MSFDKSEYQVVVASDVCTRDGVGIEISRNGEMLCEIFRDDTDLNRTVSVFKETISLEEMEGFIEIFKEKIDWEFIDYDTFNE